MLTQERLKALLHYDPDTGIFTFLVGRGGKHVGMRAGYINDAISHVCRRVGVDGKRYRTSHLAWLYMTGKWPLYTLDHINRDSLDDRWINLREATPSEQCVNRRNWGKYARGVSYQNDRFSARISRRGKTLFLGKFTTEAEAAAAYQAAAARFGYNEYIQ